MSEIPASSLELRSLVTARATLELSLVDASLAALTVGQVLPSTGAKVLVNLQQSR